MTTETPVLNPVAPPIPTAGSVRVVFTVPPGLAQHAQLIAEFTSWTPMAMDRRDDGAHEVSVWLPGGHVWGYQFVLDDRLVVNDPGATEFVRRRDGGHVSLVRV